MNIRNWIKQLMATRRDRKRRASADEISSRITLRERNGHLYIVCMGTAVWLMGDSDTCQWCVNALHRVQRYARDYALGIETEREENKK